MDHLPVWGQVQRPWAKSQSQGQGQGQGWSQGTKSEGRAQSQGEGQSQGQSQAHWPWERWKVGQGFGPRVSFQQFTGWDWSFKAIFSWCFCRFFALKFWIVLERKTNENCHQFVVEKPSFWRPSRKWFPIFPSRSWRSCQNGKNGGRTWFGGLFTLWKYVFSWANTVFLALLPPPPRFYDIQGLLHHPKLLNAMCAGTTVAIDI